ncbi:hypothetical protein EDB80DRAFT_684137 [Ilyonectria destructans]|nr:hypothetical protein EDB80DRAFT_684137 [Ilyonectria destructans]
MYKCINSYGKVEYRRCQHTDDLLVRDLPATQAFQHLQITIISNAVAKSVLITGCSAGGIGNAFTRTFTSRDIKVFATAYNASRIIAAAIWKYIRELHKPLITIITIGILHYTLVLIAEELPILDVYFSDDYILGGSYNWWGARS